MKSKDGWLQRAEAMMVGGALVVIVVAWLIGQFIG